MAETSFSKIDPNVPLPQAGVNRVGGGWDTGGAVDRADRTTYLPLAIPIAGAGTAQLVEVPKPPPSEQQLRATLAQVITAMQFANAQLDRSSATHQRSIKHAEHCREHLQTFDGLDDQITAQTIAALQSGDGRPRGGQDDELRQRIAERDVARANATASERAQRLLSEALVDASDDAAKAALAARRAALAVAAVEAAKLAQRVIDLEDEAKRTRERVYGFDRLAVNSHLALPPALHAVLWADDGHQLRRADSSSWQAAIDQLLTDASAEVSIEIPPPAPPRPRQPGLEVRRAIPIRRPEAEEEAAVNLLLEPGTEEPS